MGWRGTIRAIEAAERRAQRGEQRRFKELQRRNKELAKLSALEQARLEVETYENQLELLLSIHKEQGNEWDWHTIAQSPAPTEPSRGNRHQADAAAGHALYEPGFFDRLFGKAKKQAAAFEVEMEAAKIRDERDFEAAWAQFQKDCASWEDERQLANDVLAGSPDAYARVLRELTPFAELSDLGSSLSFRVHSPRLVEVSVKVNGEQVIPAEIKSLTATGKVSSKAMPKARFNEIYADYVAGCVLRVGREVLVLLPVETVLVTALTDLFDSRTGRTAEQPVLSAALTRAVMQRLNYDRLDTSDAMENFFHRGDFKASRKSGAFVPITPLTTVDIEAPPVVQTVTARGPAAPPPLMAPTVNPFPTKWAEALRRNEIEFGFLRLTTNELAELLGKAPQDNFTLPESKALARTAESFGYCLEPDPRYGAGNFWGTREVGLFQPPSGHVDEPSDNFLGASALLQLCLLVAAADGAIDRSELDPFRQFIESHFQFTPDEHQRLIVLETLLVRNAAAAKVTLGRTAKRVPQDKHLVIAQFLVEVAAADAVITPKEHKSLARIFDALGLSDDTLDALIRNLPTSGREVVVQSAEVEKAGEAIPSPIGKLAGAPASFSLDMSRVAAISAETHEVIGLLAKAMSEEESAISPAKTIQATVAASPTVPSPSPSTGTGQSLPSNSSGALAVPAEKLNALDGRFHPVLLRLAGRDTWSRGEFDALAREHGLMPHGVLDTLNEWADEHLGDFVLEGEDPITVHRQLLAS